MTFAHTHTHTRNPCRSHPLHLKGFSEIIDYSWLWGVTPACNLTTHLSGRNTPPAFWSPIYHPHISVNNQGGMQLVTWKGFGESHVTDQSSRDAARSLGWFTAQQFVPAQPESMPSIFFIWSIQGWKYASVKRPPLLRLPVTPGAAHNQPRKKKKRKKKRQSVAVSRESSAEWKGTSYPPTTPISLTLISSVGGYFLGSLCECWVNDSGCVSGAAEAASFFFFFLCSR